jgi:porphobilinogen synthase
MQPVYAPFPMTRFRRTRRTAALRALTEEVTLSANDLIWPLFVRDGTGEREPVLSMPGVDRLSIDLVV